MLPANGIKVSDIQDALRSKSGADVMKMLVSLADLFGKNQNTLSRTQVGVFDEVMLTLVDQIEKNALVEFSARVGGQPHVPPGIVKRLARDDRISVAAPVLTNSSALTDDDLVEIASTKSQAHLASIARRSRLSEVVTDVLVDRGDSTVANEVAVNPGAKLSELTAGKLIMRADGDDRLTESMFARRDLSPNHFRQLVSQATSEVRQSLAKRARPDQLHLMDDVLAQVAERVAAKASGLRDYEAAKRVVARFSQDTRTTKLKLGEFTRHGKIAEAVVALSVLSGIEIDDLDVLLDRVDPLPVLIVCRSLELDWETVGALVLKCWPDTRQHSGRSQQSYYELAPHAARSIVRFWQGRKRATEAMPRSEPVGAKATAARRV
jgi:uncharacterized protein (DUF2336 family)